MDIDPSCRSSIQSQTENVPEGADGQNTVTELTENPFKRAQTPSAPIQRDTFATKSPASTSSKQPTLAADVRLLITGILSEARKIDPQRPYNKTPAMQKRVARMLGYLIRPLKVQIPPLKRTISAGGPAALKAAAEFDQLASLLNDFAAPCSFLGEYGARVMQGAAKTLFGKGAHIVESSQGKFALWNSQNKFAPALVAELPGTLRHDSLNSVQPLAAPPAVGDHPLDHVALGESASLAHIGVALGAPTMTAGSVVEAHTLTIKSRPDPSAHMREVNHENAKKVIGAGSKLSVVTYNVALLEYKVFGFYKVRESPFLEPRRNALAAQFCNSDIDVINLQEVWRKEDVDFFSAYAVDHGYRAFVGPRDAYTDGLLTFVKERVIAGSTPVTHRTRAFEEQDAKEYLAAEITSLGFDVGVKRGYHEVGFRHKNGGDVVLFNTHTLPFPNDEAQRGRTQQARELGIAMSGAATASNLVLGTGDMNSGYFYNRDSWKSDSGEQSHGWFRNAIAQPVLDHYANAVDILHAGSTAELATAEVDVGLQVPMQGEVKAVYPFTADSWSNQAYESQYGRDEYPACLDRIKMVNNPNACALNVEMSMTEEIRVGPRTVIEGSDHYAMKTVISWNPTPVNSDNGARGKAMKPWQRSAETDVS